MQHAVSNAMDAASIRKFSEGAVLLLTQRLEDNLNVDECLLNVSVECEAACYC
jgi:hypothetical protein